MSSQKLKIFAHGVKSAFEPNFIQTAGEAGSGVLPCVEVPLNINQNNCIELCYTGALGVDSNNCLYVQECVQIFDAYVVNSPEPFCENEFASVTDALAAGRRDICIVDDHTVPAGLTIGNSITLYVRANTSLTLDGSVIAQSINIWGPGTLITGNSLDFMCSDVFRLTTSRIVTGGKGFNLLGNSGNEMFIISNTKIITDDVRTIDLQMGVLMINDVVVESQGAISRLTINSTTNNADGKLYLSNVEGRANTIINSHCQTIITNSSLLQFSIDFDTAQTIPNDQPDVLLSNSHFLLEENQIINQLEERSVIVNGCRFTGQNDKCLTVQNNDVSARYNALVIQGCDFFNELQYQDDGAVTTDKSVQILDNTFHGNGISITGTSNFTNLRVSGNTIGDQDANTASLSINSSDNGITRKVVVSENVFNSIQLSFDGRLSLSKVINNISTNNTEPNSLSITAGRISACSFDGNKLANPGGDTGVFTITSSSMVRSSVSNNHAEQMVFDCNLSESCVVSMNIFTGFDIPTTASSIIFNNEFTDSVCSENNMTNIIFLGQVSGATINDNSLRGVLQFGDNSNTITVISSTISNNRVEGDNFSSIDMQNNGSVDTLRLTSVNGNVCIDSINMNVSTSMTECVINSNIVSNGGIQLSTTDIQSSIVSNNRVSFNNNITGVGAGMAGNVLAVGNWTTAAIGMTIGITATSGNNQP